MNFDEKDNPLNGVEVEGQQDIVVERVESWHATFKATRGLNQAFGETEEEAIENLINVESF